VRVTNAVLPTMRQQRSGLIINVSSLAGLVGVPGQGFYAASKHALEGYTETLQSELQQFNIRVSLVEPGFFRTHLDRSMLHGAVASPTTTAFVRRSNPRSARPFQEAATRVTSHRRLSSLPGPDSRSCGIGSAATQPGFRDGRPGFQRVGSWPACVAGFT
jgi:short-subunit dehydrogenase